MCYVSFVCLFVCLFVCRCLSNLYKLEVFKNSIKEPLNVQMSNLLKVSESSNLSVLEGIL